VEGGRESLLTLDGGWFLAPREAPGKAGLSSSPPDTVISFSWSIVHCCGFAGGSSAYWYREASESRDATPAAIRRQNPSGADTPTGHQRRARTLDHETREWTRKARTPSTCVPIRPAQDGFAPIHGFPPATHRPIRACAAGSE
jgi:hypothetical protein